MRSKRNDFYQKTFITADRAFEAYNLIAHMLEKPNVDFLIRVKQSRSAMREVAKLPMLELDCDISFSICTTQKNRDKQNKNYVFLQVPKKSKPGSKTRRGRWDFENYYPMRFRICRFQLDNGEFETVATSLPRSFRLEDIKAPYHLRWGLEVGFRDLKYTLGLVNLHGKSDAFAEQEIYASLTAFNFASRVCREVVVRQPKDGVYAYKSHTTGTARQSQSPREGFPRIRLPCGRLKMRERKFNLPLLPELLTWYQREDIPPWIFLYHINGGFLQ